MIDPEQALQILKEGNHNFLHDNPPCPPTHLGREQRLRVARAQHPFAVLVSCSDSRVPPEILFGRGLGELFIVRNAGNTVDNVALGSIEYAVHVLAVRLIVVLGHQRCGAVQAAIDAVQQDAHFPGNLHHIIQPIIPSVHKAIATTHPVQLWDAAARENIRRVVHQLRNAQPILTHAIHTKDLRIVGAYYTLDDGKVEFLDA